MFLKRVLPVAMALGTAWAARGQIGHEYGAAWAGAIGVFVLVAVSNRTDWYQKLPTVVSMGAVAWGFTGIISYGKVVGYGHMADYLNTSYGLLMLLFIGALYGFIGSGITGLTLESSEQRKVDWPALLTQMVAGGILGWGLLIYELEWVMTPPRSELWAACLGSALALGWYIYRNGFHGSLRTAWFTALGAGLGFALGNFLQRMGNTTGIFFNWWNVMEYSIGFCGGMGMAYGVYGHAEWPFSSKPDPVSNKIGWLFLLVMLPATVLFEGAGKATLEGTGKGLNVASPESFAFTWQLVMWVMSALVAAGLYFYRRSVHQLSRTQVVVMAIIYLTWYVLISNFVSATWLTAAFSSQHLYWLNLIILYLLIRKPGYVAQTSELPYVHRMLNYWITAISIVLLLSWIAVQTGKVNPNTKGRWEAWQ